MPSTGDVGINLNSRRDGSSRSPRILSFVDLIAMHRIYVG